MAKRALLIGCNYAGTEAHLFGCVNDVAAMKSLLMDVYGFQETDCVELTDGEETGVQPTGANIKEKLTELVAASEPGDVLFVHFSGHGVQIPSTDGGEEADQHDEAIVPSDFNLVVDDDLRAIVKDLKEGVHFTFVTDCCHSGGLLDHVEVQISGTLEANSGLMDVESFMHLLGLKRNYRVNDPATLGPKKLKNRSLSTDVLLRSLGDKKGEPVKQDTLRQSLAAMFGAQASVKFQDLLSQVTQAGTIESVATKLQDTGKRGCWASLLAAFGLAPATKPKPASKPQTSPASNAASGQKVKQQPAVKQALQKDVGVLITGCMSDEQSADANISGKKKKAMGAMTNALITTIRAHDKKSPGAPISNKDLVHAVRGVLNKAGFKQHPCLEGSEKNANAGFVTGEVIPVEA